MWQTNNRKRGCISLTIELHFTLNCNSEGYIFLKLLLNSRWTFMARKLFIKQKLFLKRPTSRKSLFLVSKSRLFYHCITARPSLSVSVRLCTCCTFSIYPKTNYLFFIFQSSDQFSLHAKETPLGKPKETCQNVKSINT